MANEPKNVTFVIIVNVNSPNPTTYKSMLELIPMKGLSNVTFVAKGFEGKITYGITSLFIPKRNLSNVKFVIKVCTFKRKSGLVYNLENCAF